MTVDEQKGRGSNTTFISLIRDVVAVWGPVARSREER